MDVCKAVYFIVGIPNSTMERPHTPRQKVLVYRNAFLAKMHQSNPHCCKIDGIRPTRASSAPENWQHTPWRHAPKLRTRPMLWASHFRIEDHQVHALYGFPTKVLLSTDEYPELYFAVQVCAIRATADGFCQCRDLMMTEQLWRGLIIAVAKVSVFGRRLHSLAHDML